MVSDFMQLRLKVEVEPYWIIGVRPVNSINEFDFKNKRDVVDKFINKVKNQFKSNVGYKTLELNAHYLVAFALDENLNGFTITNVVASSEWTGDFLKIDYIIDFEYRGLFNPFKTVNEDDLRDFIVKWIGDERLYIMDDYVILSDDTYDYRLDVDTSPRRVRIEHELKR